MKRRAFHFPTAQDHAYFIRMRFSSLSSWLCLAVIWLAPLGLSAQTAGQPARPAPPRIEPGLETAVKWKWWVVPSDDKEWGVPLPEPEQPKPVPGKPGDPTITSVHIPEERPTVYEVKKGDALIIIAKKFSMKVAELKTFNGMKDDKIKVGQELRIPTFDEIKAMQPPPPPPQPEKKPEEAKPDDKKGKKKKGEAKPDATPEASRELDNLLIQVFLDREQFSVGPIDGKAGAVLLKTAGLYESSHTDVGSTDALRNKAKSVVGDPYTSYRLRKEDFRFIAPPRALAATDAGGKEKKSPKPKSKAGKDTPPPPRTYEQMITVPFLGYQTPWEFVAERFHCDESYLRRLNHAIKATPIVGTEFKVPNVIPFEIEKALDSPLQPAANPDKPVTAAIVEMSRLEISQNNVLVAVMPLASAHADLHGRGTWTVLDVIPHPRMATRQEVIEQPKPKVTSNLLGSTAEENAIPMGKAVAPPPLDHEQYLPAGPENPVGILWINLSKAKTTDPLPYGLHGTSIPEHMSTQHGIGGLRLANWNIARAVHLLPPGTPVQWKQH
jgi:LysM repeat protein